jgi:hypothetical protein
LRPGCFGSPPVVTERAVAVLDGATSWLPQPEGRDGGWHARTFGEALRTRLDSNQQLSHLVSDAIREIRDQHSLTPGNSPESTLTIARHDRDHVEIYILGDSPAVIFPKGNDVHAIHDRRLEPVGAEYRSAYRAYLANGNGYDATPSRES